MSLNDTPRSQRLHIGIFGKRNAGKSTLINALTGQQTALVSEVAGTTTDVVYKAMELHGIGPVVFLDTAGLDDFGELGKKRIEKTLEALKRVDIAIAVFVERPNVSDDWFGLLKKRNIPIVPVLNKVDELNNDDAENIAREIERVMGEPPIRVSAIDGGGVDELREALIRHVPEDFEAERITHGLVERGDIVLLIMPQDIQAPKGRLILPQVQTIRELLDLKCVVVSSTTDMMQSSLDALACPPKLIITDSQAFKEVYAIKPKESLLTSFSILMAGYKGDIEEFVRGAQAIERLTEKSQVLIAEACTHAPLSEDIGREKIPRLLRKRIGEGLKITIVSGTDFPNNLSKYDLIIHCGACMFNRRYVISRIEQAKEQGVPITNYGVALAYLNNILDKITI